MTCVCNGAVPLARVGEVARQSAAIRTRIDGRSYESNWATVIFEHSNFVLLKISLRAGLAFSYTN